MKQFIGIKKVWYTNPIITLSGSESTLTGTVLKTLLSDAANIKEVKNLHQDTWGYEESDSTITEYVNQLTGRPYYRDAESQGVPTISFTMGEYDFKDKEALQGGKATETSWERSSVPALINKAIIAQTKTGNYIVFPNASIVAKGNFVEKNIGLGISAVAMETGSDKIPSEKWFDKSEIETSAGV